MEVTNDYCCDECSFSTSKDWKIEEHYKSQHPEEYKREWEHYEHHVNPESTALKYRTEKLKLSIMEDMLKREIQELREEYSPRIIEHKENVSKLEGEIDKWEWDGASHPFCVDGVCFTVKRTCTKRTIVEDENAVIMQLKRDHFYHAIKESVKKASLKQLIQDDELGDDFVGAHIEEHVSYGLEG